MRGRLGQLSVGRGGVALLALGLLTAACSASVATPSVAVSPSVADSQSASAGASASTSPGPSYPPTPSPPACVTAGSLECFQAALAEQAAKGAFAGVVLVAEHWTVLWQGAYGTVGGSGPPYTADSRVPIHSVGKMFTAVAIGQLIESGVVSLDDTLDTYVPSLQVDVGHATIAQLLSHTSGISDSFTTQGLEFLPGTFNYANRNFVFLGRIVEAVTGEPFQAYLDEKVFAPAGMTATGTSGERPIGAPAAADGQQSTLADLLRFADALFSYRLLSEATTRQFTSPQAGTDGSYGFGFMIFYVGDQPRATGHFGTDGRAQAVLVIDPTSESAMAMFGEQGFAALDAALQEYPPYWPR